MNSNKLKLIVQIWKFTPTNVKGKVVKDYGEEPFATRRAGVVEQATNEVVQAHRKQEQNTTIYVFRYPLDVKPIDQLRIGSRTLEVLSVVNVNEENRWLHVTAKEVT